MELIWAIALSVACVSVASSAMRTSTSEKYWAATVAAVAAGLPTLSPYDRNRHVRLRSLCSAKLSYAPSLIWRVTQLCMAMAST